MTIPNWPPTDGYNHLRLELNHELTNAITAYAVSMRAIRRMVEVSPMDHLRVRSAFDDVEGQTDRAIDILRRLRVLN